MKFIKIICIFILTNIVIYGETQIISVNKIVKGGWNKNTNIKFYTFRIKSKRFVKFDVMSRAGVSIDLYDKNGNVVDYITGYRKILSKGTYTIKLTRRYSNNTARTFMLKVNAGTLEIFEGYDKSTEGLVKSSRAKYEFISNLTQVHTENFENGTVLKEDGGTLNFGTGGTALLDPEVNNGAIWVSDYVHDGEKPISGTKYLDANYATFTLYFSNPVSAFGFYVTDLGDGRGGVFIAINYANHSSESVGVYGAGNGSVGYFSFIQRDPNKIITSVTLHNTSYGIFSYDACGYDDFSITDDEHVKNQYQNTENLPSISDPFFSYTWIDTDNDGIVNSIDKDDDGDGISDVQEKAHNMNPLNAADAQADFDHDGFSNSIEISIGTNIRNPNSKPIWAPILMDGIIIFIPAKP